MDHHIGLDGLAVQDVAPKVSCPGPPARRRIERTPRHPDDPLDLGRTFERLDRRDADIVTATVSAIPVGVPRRRVLETRQALSASTACAAL